MNAAIQKFVNLMNSIARSALKKDESGGLIKVLEKIRIGFKWRF